jgi:cytochrome c biogenesis protein CcmG, thiol:disulfide interchange protein DsbE
MTQALRTAAIVAIVIVLALGYLQLAGHKGYALSSGTPAPGFRLPSLAGGETELASLRGKVVVVNFWATWCPPCVDEMPSLERLHRALGPEGLAVLAVSTDEDLADLRRFVGEQALTLPVLRDPGGRVAADDYHTTGYPETFVIDRSGVLLQHTVGPAEWDTPQALAYFRGLLGSASPPPPAPGASTR